MLASRKESHTTAVGSKEQSTRTLLLVNSKHDDDLIAPDSNELLDRSDTSS